MNQNQRPHSRQKTTGSGTAGVGKGSQVNTGSRPVGSGGRTPGAPGGAPQRGAGPQRASTGLPFNVGGKKLSLKSLLIIGLAVIVLFVAIRSCGGGRISDYSDYTGYDTYPESVYTPSTSSSYTPSTSTSLYGNYPSIGQTTAITTPASYDAANYSVSNDARGKYYQPSGDGDETVTIMLYMCGTDLESKYGMASKDLQEMLNATVSDRVNLIVETGGCKQWKNKVISNQKNEIYKIEDDGLRRLESNFGTAAMTDPNNLTKFIKYCESNYEADRYMLIFWDHGGGSLSGYGYDEKNPEKSSMTLSKINSALAAAKDEDGDQIYFDVIGFDACLMATLETAFVTERYADYLLASEETEPGTGWYYTDWLTELSRDPEIPTVDLGKTVIDTFIKSSGSASGSKVTLSLVDLAELSGTVPDAFRTFASATNERISDGDYKTISEARAGVRQFSASNKINQVDLIDLADRIGSTEAKELAEVLRGAVKYNKSTMSRCYGVSIYFPYESTKSVNTALATYKDIGIADEYSACIRSFASVGVGGQVAAASTQMQGGYSSSQFESLLGGFAASGSSTSPLDALLGSFASGSVGSSSSSPAGYGLDPTALLGLLGGFSGRSMPGDYDWVDGDLIADQAENIVKAFIDPSHLAAADKNGTKVLSLTDDEWGLIESLELNVFVNDGEGFIDLGLDNTFDFDDDGDLLLDFDGTWLTLNGQVAGYYMESDTEQDDGSWVTIGRIPAKLNGQLVNLQVRFDDDNPAGVITGAYPLYEEDVSDVQAKGELEIVEGDEIQLLCDYYDLDGNYSAAYTLGDSFKVPASGLKLENLTLDVEREALSVAYRLTDIYGNHYWVVVD